MKLLLLFLLRIYKLTISPFLGQNCRFYPSCSAYAELALRRHGVISGSVLAGKRLCKCHPWHDGGIDLVPEIYVDQQREKDKTRLKLARFTCSVASTATHQFCSCKLDFLRNLLRGRDLGLGASRKPHVLKYTPVVRSTPTVARSLRLRKKSIDESLY